MPASSATAAIRSSLPFAAAALALAGCEEAGEQPRRGLPEQAQPGHCRSQSFQGSSFTVCRYDARAHRLELAVAGEAGPLRSFEALELHLGERAGRLLFAMNAGMYDEGGRPIGLYVEQGERQRRVNLRNGPGNFHMQPNGVFDSAASACNRRGY